ncbi:hypothetical protein JS532_05690 [Bifidobacterium callimiconis]|uniref:hypothetical protein n=1 Tax=Bifidobacterium callimiconis TaxID=2306973 RepID=UPI001BDCA0AA|nr:hypothetical protein [Bifidobacterium callimiconis]MBT1177062.1 hypothetical protein [Bifidobacterium callimiconis]
MMKENGGSLTGYPHFRGFVAVQHAGGFPKSREVIHIVIHFIGESPWITLDFPVENLRISR